MGERMPRRTNSKAKDKGRHRFRPSVKHMRSAMGAIELALIRVEGMNLTSRQRHDIEDALRQALDELQIMLP